MTDDPDVRMAQSIVDYIFRRLALDFLPFETRSALGIHSAEERQRHLDTGSYEPAFGEEDLEGMAQSAPLPVEPLKAVAPAEESVAEKAGPQDRAHLGRTGRDAARYQRGRTAVLLVRYEDAACGLLLHLRGLRLDQRLQLSMTAAAPDKVSGAARADR